MKRLIAIFLLAVMVLSMAACEMNEQKKEYDTDPADSIEADTKKEQDPDDPKDETTEKDPSELSEDELWALYASLKERAYNGDVEARARLEDFIVVYDEYYEDGELYISYTYDENGLLRKENYYQKNYSINETAYLYDENGVLIKKNHYYKDGDLYSETDYTYDKSGKLIKEVETGYYSNVDQIRTTLYSYDSNGRLISKEINEGSDIHPTYFTYDEKGNLIKKEEKFPYGGIYEYKYDENGNKVIEEAIEAAGFTKSHIKYFYDSKGNPIKIEDDFYMEDWKNDEKYYKFHHTTFYENTYNEKGCKIKTQYTYDDHIIIEEYKGWRIFYSENKK